jgi:hypothetical protein
MWKTIRRSVWLPAILLFFLALIPRLIGLDKVISVDEQLWIERSVAFWRGLISGDLAATYQSAHPGVTTMWTGGLGLLWLYVWQGHGTLGDFLASAMDTVPYWTLLTAMRWPTLLITSASVSGVYALLRRLEQPTVAGLTGLLLALDPLYLAHSRVLHHDALFTAFATLGLFSWLALLLAENHPRWLLWVSGVFIGLAGLSKLSAGALALSIPLITVASLGWQRASRAVWLQWGKRLVLWGLAAALTVGILLPALWVSPQKIWENSLSFAQEASEEGHERGTFFMGQPQPDGNWLFYPVNAAFTLSLGAMAGLALVAWAGLRRQMPEMNRRALGLAWIAGFLFLLVITVASKKQARYVLPLFPLLDWLAGVGWAWLWVHLCRRSPMARGGPALLTVGLAACLVPYYPYYFSYYNPLLGGGNVASQAVLVGRGEGLEAAAAYLNARPDASHLQVASWYGTTFRPLFAGKTVDIVHPYNLVSSDYVVYYANQWQRGLPDEASLAYFAAQTPEKVISQNGIEYARIYRAPGAGHPIQGDARLEGQARLLAFSLGKGDAGLAAIPSNATTRLSLYWLWLGHPETDALQISLVDGDGLTWGWGYSQGETWPPAATAGSQEAIVRSDFDLHVFPGTPPGTYYLRAWVDRSATGQTIGVFPLEQAEAAVRVEAATVQPAVGDLPLARPMMIELSPGVTLLGCERVNWDKPWSPGEARQVTLYWRSDLAGGAQRTSSALRLVDMVGEVRAQWVAHPLADLYPAAMWQAGQVVRDPWPLALPPYVPPGDYRLEVAWGDQAATPLVPELRVTGRERSFSLPEDVQHPLTLRLGDSIYLRGYTLASAAGKLSITLDWQTAALIGTDYTVFVQLLDAEGRIVAQKDQYPLAGVAPTSTWAAGEVVIDPYDLSLPKEMGPGPHQLIVGMYLADTGRRLPIFDQAGRPVGDHFALDLSSYLP